MCSANIMSLNVKIWCKSVILQRGLLHISNHYAQIHYYTAFYLRGQYKGSTVDSGFVINKTVHVYKPRSRPIKEINTEYNLAVLILGIMYKLLYIAIICEEYRVLYTYLNFHIYADINFIRFLHF